MIGSSSLAISSLSDGSIVIAKVVRILSSFFSSSSTISAEVRVGISSLVPRNRERYAFVFS